MFCSDDKHPDDLVAGHMNQLVKRAVQKGFDPLRVLRSCVYNPVRHYNLDVGLLKVGDPADYIIVDDLKTFTVLETRINGIKVAEKGRTCIDPVPVHAVNNFSATFFNTEDIAVPGTGSAIRVQKALDGQLITGCDVVAPYLVDGLVVSDTQRDILKLVVQGRYEPSPPVVGFAGGIGLQQGAIASSVAHDSHNIIAVGVDDVDIARAINLLIEHKGGISFVSGKEEHVLPLPVAGLMSMNDGYDVARQYKGMDALAKEDGATLDAPFMTLSFMALLIIPALKISDKGIFDGNTFSFTSLFAE
jgi:adenine deaminase